MKTGLFFGSFNPLHIGHMTIAQYMVEFTDLEQVWFVVSPQNPFKEKQLIRPASPINDSPYCNRRSSTISGIRY